MQSIKPPPQTPFTNPDPLQYWYREENVARIRFNGESCMALLDNGAQINTITPNYVKSHSMKMGPMSDLVGAWVVCMGLGNACTESLGYVTVQVQVEGVKGYDEDQVALVVPDSSNFATRILVILGTPTIGHVVNVIKEKEMDALAMPWANVRVAHLLLVCGVIATEVHDGATDNSVSEGYNELVYTKEVETVDAFSSQVIPVKMERAYRGDHINVMTQAL